MGKTKKEKLTPEEKALKKAENKYKIFRNKILAIIGTVLFVVGFVLPCVITTGKSNDTSVTMFASIGALLMIATSFLIFRKFSLSAMLIGAGLIDLSFVVKSSDSSTILLLGIVAFAIGFIALASAKKSHNKKKGNHKITLEAGMVETLIFSENGAYIGDVLGYASYQETLYQAKLNFIAGIVSLLACGIGFVLPFGARAFKLYKGLGFLTCDVKEIESKKYNEKKPYGNLVYGGEVYIGGKSFSCKSKYFTFAPIAALMGYGYVIIECIYHAIIKKPLFMDEDAVTAGNLIFATSLIESEEHDITQLLVNYSQQQSDENRQYLIDALVDMKESFEEWSKREGARIAAYEEEKVRWARSQAVGVSVKTDGQDNYVEGEYADGTKGLKKLENYDETTGVGEFTDESGNKIKVKNTNVKK